MEQKSRINLRAIRDYRKMNIPFLVVFLLLSAYGLLMLFSASIAVSFAREGTATDMVVKQAIISGAGLIAALIIAFMVRIRLFNKPIWRHLIYGLGTFFLVLVWLFGETINGAQRWLFIGPISFQPSEFAKLASVLFLATYFAEMKKKRRRGMFRRVKLHLETLYEAWIDFVKPALMMALWFVMILIQPHVSGALIFSLIVIFMFAMSGMPKRSFVTGCIIMLILILVAALILALAWPLFRKDTLPVFISERFAHAFGRVSTYQNPDEASRDDILQIEQARIALGSGGIYGIGLGRSVQKLNWLPESHNDYILPIIGEELGFFGTMVCLVLFVFFFIFGIGIAVRSATPMTALVAAGYTFLITLQALLNFGVATQILPATGISLPFFSSGGTANFFFMIAAGMILCVSKSGQQEDPDIANMLMSEASRNSKNQKRPSR
jgi:cell division protein FtsW